jgi:hypothetical protein
LLLYFLSFGDKGTSGDKGAGGDKGPTGNKGATGDKGMTGNKGAIGDKGLTGIYYILLKISKSFKIWKSYKPYVYQT